MPSHRAQGGPDEAQVLTLVRLTADHLPQALDLSREMNWPYRLEDWAFAHALGHGLALEEGGRLVATAMWWPNGAAFATAGMIIVTSALQGRGLGARIFDALLDEMQGRTVVLNSTAEGAALYQRRGFSPVGEVHQHQGVLALQAPASSRGALRPASAGDRHRVETLDEEALGRPRASLLESLWADGRCTVLERDGAPQGFAFSRRFGRGHVIGPAIAADLQDAQALIEAAAADLVGSFVRLDTPADLALGPWLEARGLGNVGAVTTMVRGGPLQTSGGRHAFALASQ